MSGTIHRLRLSRRGGRRRGRGKALLAFAAALLAGGLSFSEWGLGSISEELTQEANALGIGPQGMGGKTTVFRINIEQCPTHIAGLPCAVNISCHVTRHAKEVL